jgi:hypothetical protein
LEPGIQDYRLLWAFGLMLWTTWRTTHLNILRICSLQSSRFYHHHTILFAF